MRRHFSRSDVRQTPVRTTARLASRRLRHKLERRFFPDQLRRERLVAFDVDLKIWLSLDDILAEVIYLDGYFEIASVEAFRRLTRPGGVVVDVGANIGQYTLLGAKAVGPSGVVLAFEPQPRNFDQLERNIRANGFRNVRTFALALSNSDATAVPLYQSSEPATYADPRRTSAHYALPSLRPTTSGQHAIEVPCRRLDEVLLSERVERVDVVKIDVEGAEPAVVEGAAAILERWHPAVLYEANDPQTSTLLQAKGYSCYGVYRDERGSVCAVPVDPNADLSWLKEYPEVPPNLLAIKPDDDRLRRFTSAGLRAAHGGA